MICLCLPSESCAEVWLMSGRNDVCQNARFGFVALMETVMYTVYLNLVYDLVKLLKENGFCLFFIKKNLLDCKLT